MLEMCRLMPSSVSSGKKNQPWLRPNQPRKPRRSSTTSDVHATTPGAMSGSEPCWLGLAWCRLCLLRHHDAESPTKPPAMIRAVQSFQAPEWKICRCALSWPRNASCVSTIARTAATASCHHESPMRTTATQTPANAAAARIIRVQ